MSRQEALKLLLDNQENETDLEWRTRMENKLDLLLSVIVVQQKDLCASQGLSPDTVRRKVLNGEANVLTPDGSRLNYIQLSEIPNLKRRTKRKQRR